MSALSYLFNFAGCSGVPQKWLRLSRRRFIYTDALACVLYIVRCMIEMKILPGNIVLHVAYIKRCQPDMSFSTLSLMSDSVRLGWPPTRVIWTNNHNNQSMGCLVFSLKCLREWQRGWKYGKDCILTPNVFNINFRVANDGARFHHNQLLRPVRRQKTGCIDRKKCPMTRYSASAIVILFSPLSRTAIKAVLNVNVTDYNLHLNLLLCM